MHHGISKGDKFNRKLAKDLVQLRQERLLYRRRPPIGLYAGKPLRPPILPKPETFPETVSSAGRDLLSRAVFLVLYAFALVFRWAALGALAYISMLIVGTIGIFLMVFIGAAVSMLQMAAY